MQTNKGPSFFSQHRLSILLAAGIVLLLFVEALNINCLTTSFLLRSQVSWLERHGSEEELAAFLDDNMYLIFPGRFRMGSAAGRSDELPQRRIHLDGYQIDRFEVTNVQYRQFLLASGETPPRNWDGTNYPEGKAAFPVLGVSWEEAQSYCEWRGKRLPSEAEWEKACRGTFGNIYPWGNAWKPDKANLNLDSAERWPLSIESGWDLLAEGSGQAAGLYPAAVGSSPYDCSHLGIFDLAGNASEWALDWYSAAGYASLPLSNPVGVEPTLERSVRGGAWFNLLGQQAEAADQSRCARRNASNASDDPRLGFRCVLPVE